jgi:hypothetical protein
VAGRVEVEERLRWAKAVLYSDKTPDGGELHRSNGKWLEALTGEPDPSFSQDLPGVGEKVVMLQALCSKYEKSLHDGDDTLSGAYVDSLERQVGMRIMRTNIARVCQRKGKDGVEPKGGQAGCVDPTGLRLRVLGMVKELYYLGLLAAGVDVVAIIASSNASILSFTNLVTENHFVQQQGEGTYAEVPFFTAPHLKYISPKCRFTNSVATGLGVSLGDALAVTSGVLEGWARVAAQIGQLARELEPLEGEPLEAAMCPVYEALRTDPKSPVVAREWADRRTTTTSPETQAKLKAALAERSRQGGEPPPADPPTCTHAHTHACAPSATAPPALAQAAAAPRATRTTTSRSGCARRRRRRTPSSWPSWSSSSMRRTTRTSPSRARPPAVRHPNSSHKTQRRPSRSTPTLHGQRSTPTLTLTLTAGLEVKAPKMVAATEAIVAAGLGAATYEEAALTGAKLAPFMAKGAPCLAALEANPNPCTQPQPGREIPTGGRATAC